MRRRWKALAGFELAVALIAVIGFLLTRPVKEERETVVLLVFPSGFSGPFRITAGDSQQPLSSLFGTYWVKVNGNGRATIGDRYVALLQPPARIEYEFTDGTSIATEPGDGRAWAESRFGRNEISGMVHRALPKAPPKID